MKKLLVAVIGLSSLLCSGAALAEGTSPESLALDHAARVARSEPRPVSLPRAVPVGCSARLLLNSTFQTVISCR